MTIELDTTNNEGNVLSELKWAKTGGAWMAARSGVLIRGEVVYSNTVPEEIKKLAETVLTVGGDMVCIPFAEDLKICNIITKFGEEIIFGKVILKKGNPSECHENSLRLWKKNSKKLKLVMGLSLTDSDQIWRMHTWLLDGKNNLIETTVIRSKYFGFVLDDRALEKVAEQFRDEKDVEVAETTMISSQREMYLASHVKVDKMRAARKAKQK